MLNEYKEQVAYIIRVLIVEYKGLILVQYKRTTQQYGSIDLYSVITQNIKISGYHESLSVKYRNIN